MSSPQTGPSSERHQHSALLAVFFCPASFFACCSIIDTFSAFEIFELFCCLSPSFPRPVVVSCVGSLSLEPPAFLCPPLPGSPMRLDPPQTQGLRCCNFALLQSFRRTTYDLSVYMNRSTLFQSPCPSILTPFPGPRNR